MGGQPFCYPGLNWNYEGGEKKSTAFHQIGAALLIKASFNLDASLFHLDLRKKKQRIWLLLLTKSAAPTVGWNKSTPLFVVTPQCCGRCPTLSEKRALCAPWRVQCLVNSFCAPWTGCVLGPLKRGPFPCKSCTLGYNWDTAASGSGALKHT